MNHKVEDNCITERIKQIFDKDGREYYLDLYKFFDQESQISLIILKLIRCKRIREIDRANCVLTSPDSMMLADLIIKSDAYFESIKDKGFKLTHWNEPTNYRKKKLGTHLLRYIIELGRNEGIKKIYGSLTHKDISDNPNIVEWYQKYGFKLEKPTSGEIGNAKYRICLYLD